MHKIIITDAPDSRRVHVTHNGKHEELPVGEEIEVNDHTLDALTASSIGFVPVGEGGGSEGGVLAEPPLEHPRKNMTKFNDVTRVRGLKAETRDLGGNPDKTDVPADETEDAVPIKVTGSITASGKIGQPDKTDVPADTPTTGADSELAGTVAEPKSKKHPLDHDGDGKKGGSRKGAAATATKGAAKRKLSIKTPKETKK